MPIRQTQVSSLPAVALRNAEIEVVIVPAVGAKITNLRRLRGREWLWRNPAVPLVPAAAGSDFALAGDSGGWDECFPTVAPAGIEVEGRGSVALDDHGELWTAAWSSTVYQTGGAPVFDAVAVSPKLPFEFRRRIRLEPDAPIVRLEYELSNAGRFAFPWIWAAHPIFSAQPGTRLELPGADRITVEHAIGRTDLAPGDQLPWTDELSVWPAAAESGWALKAFVHSPTGIGVIHDPTRDERLVVTVDPTEVPHFGLWINRGGWPAPDRGSRTLGLEPAIGPTDGLDRAIERGLARRLEPEAQVRWQVSIELPEP